MRTPPQLAIPDSAKAVTAEVKRLLRAADVRDRVPTPKSQILACARLVEMGELADGATSFFVSYSIPSASFTLGFGDPLQLLFINPDHELGHILNNGRIGEIILTDLNGFNRTCTVECYCNNYHTFVLIHPNDVAPSRRTVHFRF